MASTLAWLARTCNLKVFKLNGFTVHVLILLLKNFRDLVIGRVDFRHHSCHKLIALRLHIPSFVLLRRSTIARIIQ